MIKYHRLVRVYLRAIVRKIRPICSLNLRGQHADGAEQLLFNCSPIPFLKGLTREVSP
jgi:hypothetical protein